MDLAVFFHARPNSVKTWLWKIEQGYVPNEKSEGYTVECIRTPTRYVVVRNPANSGLAPKFTERIKTPTRYKIKKTKAKKK